MRRILFCQKSKTKRIFRITSKITKSIQTMTLIQITTIVMEIIMIMSSTGNWLDIKSLIIGIVSGLICTGIIWLIKQAPRLKICKRIAYNPEEKKYRFKIQNTGNDIISILNSYIVLCFKGDYYHIKGIEIPMMHSKRKAKGMKMRYAYERLITIDVQRIKRDTILKTTDSELIDKFDSQTLSLRDFIGRDKNLRIVVLMTALNCRTNTTRVFCDSLNNNILEGKYENGEDIISQYTTPTD